MTKRNISPIEAIYFDSGDTLMSEMSEIKDGNGVTLEADLLPGAADVVRTLHEQGHKVGLLADGRPGTYRNVYSHYGIYDLFSAVVVSNDIGVEKPDGRMFQAACDALGIKRENAGSVVMVGNRLERDVAGSNRFGFISVWLNCNWSGKARTVIETPDE